MRSEVERRAGPLLMDKSSSREKSRTAPEEKKGPYVLFLVRPDGIGNYYKAQTALYMRTSTHAAADRFDMAGQVTRVKLNQYWVSGGLPIIVDDQLIGTIGVGGSNKDEECAYAGLVAVLGPQPPLTVTKPRTPAPDQVPPQR